MSIVAVEAKPLSRKQIRDFVTQIRKATRLEGQACVDVERLIDHILPEALSGFYYEVKEMDEMGEKHGEADPANRSFSLRADVFEGMTLGRGRDRQTVIHELGHLLLHTPDRIVLNRRGGVPPAYRCPEWQANCFAGEFLGHFSIAQGCNDAGELARKAVMSPQAAEVQWRAFCADGIVGVRKK